MLLLQDNAVYYIGDIGIGPLSLLDGPAGLEGHICTGKCADLLYPTFSPWFARCDVPYQASMHHTLGKCMFLLTHDDLL